MNAPAVRRSAGDDALLPSRAGKTHRVRRALGALAVCAALALIPRVGAGSSDAAPADPTPVPMPASGGAAYAWGINSYGELGNGTQTDSSTPVAVSGLGSGVTAIAVGACHGLAVKDGHVYAWGQHFIGQLGDGTRDDHLTAEEIDPADLNTIIAVAVGAFSSYALSSDGSLWVWGSNWRGLLGLGSTTEEYLTPQHLLPPSGFAYTAISANTSGAFAVAILAPVPQPSP